MKVQKNNYVKIVKTVDEVETYLAKLKYALSLDNTIIEFQESRHADFARMIQDTNKYTIAELFPNESAKIVIKEELKKLKTTEYIETVKGIEFLFCPFIFQNGLLRKRISLFCRVGDDFN